MKGWALEGDGYQLTYSSEHGLRDDLADYAHACGWDAETEHIVPGWGRPDLYLTCGYFKVAVELKLDLRTQSQCRKAIQQADSYRVALPEATDVLLVSGYINRSVMAEYEGRYPSVGVFTANQFTQWIAGCARTLTARRTIAEDRFHEQERQLELRRRVLSDMSRYAPESAVPSIPDLLSLISPPEVTS